MSVLKSLFAENSASSNNGPFSIENVSVAEEVLEVAEGYQEIVATEDAIERLDEIHEGLSSLIELSEDSLEHGGLTSETAKIIGISAGALVAPLGLSTPILSVESFGGDSERLTSTRISIEDSRSTLQKVWDAIENAVRSLRDKIQKWYSNMFKNVDKVEATVKKLKETVGKLEGSAKKDKVKYNLNKLITKGQSVEDSGRNINRLSTMIVAIVNKEPINIVNSILTAFKSIDAKSAKEEDVNEFKSTIDDDMKKYTGLSSNTKDTATVKSMESSDSDVTVTKHQTLPGNKAAFSYYSSENPKKCNWKIGPDSDDGKVGNEEMDVPTKAFLVGLVNILEELVNAMKAAKGNIDDYRKSKDGILDAGKDFVRLAKTGDDGASTAAQKIVGEMRVATNVLNNPVNGLMSVAFDSVGAAVRFTGAMVKQYS